MASATVTSMPFLPDGTINQEGINCPGSEKFRLIFARVLPPRDPQRCPQALCPDKLTLPAGPSTSQHPTTEASLLRASPTSFSSKRDRPFFPALFGKLWKEVKSSPGCGEAPAAGSCGAGSSKECCEEPAPVTGLPGWRMWGLQRRWYLAVHRDVEADAVELQQVPVELPLGVPVVRGSSAGDVRRSSESRGSSAQAAREEGCRRCTTAGAIRCVSAHPVSFSGPGRDQCT